MAIKLGDKVTDSVSGFTGIAIARTEYMFRSAVVGVEADDTRDGKAPDTAWFDERRLMPAKEPRKIGLTELLQNVESEEI